MKPTTRAALRTATRTVTWIFLVWFTMLVSALAFEPSLMQRGPLRAGDQRTSAVVGTVLLVLGLAQTISAAFAPALFWRWNHKARSGAPFLGPRTTRAQYAIVGLDFALFGAFFLRMAYP